MRPSNSDKQYPSKTHENESKQERQLPLQRFKLQETRTLMLQGSTNLLPNVERTFTDLSITVGTSIPDEVEVQGNNIFVKYPSVQAAVSVYEHLNGEMEVSGQKIIVEYFPARKIDLTVAYDWYCQKCDYKNFARRGKCYRCQSQKTPTCKLSYSTQPSSTSRPFKQETAQNCSLMLRGAVLCEMEENLLLELFESVASVKDVRQIRNKMTGGYKDFAFIQFFTPEDTAAAFRQANQARFRVAGERVTAMFSRNKSDDDYFKPLPYETSKRERRAKEKPQQEDNYYHRQRQRQIQQEKARPSITMQQLKQKRQQEMKKHQPAQKQMSEEQSRRRKAELLAKQWQRQMKTQVTMYICPICCRKFINQDKMKLHQKMSELHAYNLSKMDKKALSL